MFCDFMEKKGEQPWPEVHRDERRQGPGPVTENTNNEINNTK